MDSEVLSDGYNIILNNGATTVNIPVADMHPNTFGFLSEHYHHGCKECGAFELDNIKVLTKK